MRRLRIPIAGLAAALTCGFLNAQPAFADSIAPSTFSATLAVGESVSIDKTVTVTQTATVPVDVFFLVDTTGSMSGAIGAVQAGFSSIVTSLTGIASDIAFGVGEYKDSTDAFRYQEDLDLTTNTASVQTALSGLSAGGGNDTPEANLYGLEHVATDTSWRAGSQRFVVWVGDAPGHNPDGGSTETSAIDALNAANVDVYAASATSGPGLNAACGTPSSSEGGDCTAGQADRIVAGAGGAFLGTFSSSSIVSAITTALTAGISSYGSVGLTTVGLPPGVSVTLPPGYTGSFDRSIDRTFDFSGVTFTGLTPGTYDFSIAAVLDGKTVIASEADHIVVGGEGPGPTPVPEPASLALLGIGLAVGARRLRRGRA